jgi:DNA-binding GntR family transcriptional regulator
MDLSALRAALKAAPPAAFGSAAGAVEGILRDAILAGHLPAGTQLKQQPLADEIGISHIPVREALRTLESEGFVVAEARRGYFVAPVSVADAQEIWTLRRKLEPMAIAASVPLAGPEHLAAAEAALRDLSGTADHLAWMRHNWRFHAALYGAAHQPRLMEILRALWSNVIRYCALLAVRETPYLRQGVHEGLLEAYRAGNVIAAQVLVMKHMNGVEERVLRVLETR